MFREANVFLAKLHRMADELEICESQGGCFGLKLGGMKKASFISTMLEGRSAER
jgi:hypothetical protein